MASHICSKLLRGPLMAVNPVNLQQEAACSLRECFDIRSFLALCIPGWQDSRSGYARGSEGNQKHRSGQSLWKLRHSPKAVPLANQVVCLDGKKAKHANSMSV